MATPAQQRLQEQERRCGGRAGGQQAEAAIVWLEDVARLDYVRYITVLSGSRAGAVRPAPPSAPAGAAARSDCAWWATPRYAAAHRWCPAGSTGGGARCGAAPRLLPQRPRPGQPHGVYAVGCPSEGVGPTVASNVAGEQTERAWGGPAAGAAGGTPGGGGGGGMSHGSARPCLACPAPPPPRPRPRRPGVAAPGRPPGHAGGRSPGPLRGPARRPGPGPPGAGPPPPPGAGSTPSRDAVAASLKPFYDVHGLTVGRLRLGQEALTGAPRRWAGTGPCASRPGPARSSACAPSPACAPTPPPDAVRDDLAGQVGPADRLLATAPGPPAGRGGRCPWPWPGGGTRPGRGATRRRPSPSARLGGHHTPCSPWGCRRRPTPRLRAALGRLAAGEAVPTDVFPDKSTKERTTRMLAHLPDAVLLALAEDAVHRGRGEFGGPGVHQPRPRPTHHPRRRAADRGGGEHPHHRALAAHAGETPVR